MKQRQVQISSGDSANAHDVRVTLVDGTPIPGVLSISVDPILPGRPITASITVMVALDLAVAAEIGTEAEHEAEYG